MHESIFIIATIIIGLSIAMLLLYLLGAKTSTPEKFLIVNSIITQILLIIVLVAIQCNKYYFLDIWLIYGAMGFAGIVCLFQMLTNKKISRIRRMH